MEVSEGRGEGRKEGDGKRVGERQGRESREKAARRSGDGWPFSTKERGGWRRRNCREKREAASVELLLLSS
jgi:hypothetical protein